MCIKHAFLTDAQLLVSVTAYHLKVLNSGQNFFKG